ncbi:MAG: hypothetical protein LBR11_11830 [Deltaproteobacteria bacterium]|jgi:methyl-accepting chemotaxis protein|nr:hypothetical protein [Deltaproteobacteria bacterium]
MPPDDNTAHDIQGDYSETIGVKDPTLTSPVSVVSGRVENTNNFVIDIKTAILEMNKFILDRAEKTNKDIADTNKAIFDLAEKTNKAIAEQAEKTNKAIFDLAEKTNKTFADTNKAIAEQAEKTNKAIFDLTENTNKTIAEIKKTLSVLDKSYSHISTLLTIICGGLFVKIIFDFLPLIKK